MNFNSPVQLGLFSKCSFKNFKHCVYSSISNWEKTDTRSNVDATGFFSVRWSLIKVEY